MNIRKNSGKNRNPYFIMYLGLAMLCCILLGVLFLSLSLVQEKKREELHTQEKLRLIAEDMERQFQTFQEINLLISVDTAYQPFYFTRNKYYEMTLLKDFAQYKNYSPLASEYFLYYQNYDTIFHSEEYTTDLSTYLSGWTDEERMELTRLLNHADKTGFFYSADALYILMPVSTVHTESFTGAVLCMVIDSAALGQRLQTVSGGLEGELSLYADGQLLYTSRSFPHDTDSDKTRMRYQLPDGMFAVSYLPSGRGFFSSLFTPIPLLLVMAAVILLLLLASLFARRSYKPILSLTQRCQTIFPALPPDAPVGNKLEELNYMMESILKKNLTANETLEDYQKLLRSQLLLLLLNGNDSFDIAPYLARAGLHFPGPCYFVIGTVFSGSKADWPHFSQEIQKRYDSLCEPEESIYIYSLSNEKSQIVASLLSIPGPSLQEGLFHDFSGFLEDFSPSPLLGCGNIYHDPSNLSASYLEALDNAKTPPFSSHEPEKSVSGFQFSPSDLYPVVNALSVGNESAALQELSSYLSRIEKAMPSLLMQQYLFASFLNELMRILHEYQITLSKQSLSLLASARDIHQFSSAASTAIQEFTVKWKEQQSRLLSDQSYQIFQYINSHFSDYSLSIDSVAGQFQTTAAAVRRAVQEHTGKNYKDYLIHLRMEYAKKLLTTDRLTVAETCQKVGYTNISYFIKAFKQQTGVTPANYKNSL